MTSGLANEGLPTVFWGRRLCLESTGKKVFVNSAKLVISDIIVANGVMHVIDEYACESATIPPSFPLLLFFVLRVANVLAESLTLQTHQYCRPLLLLSKQWPSLV